MRFLQAGGQELIALDPDHDAIRNVVRQAGFDCSLEDETRRLVLEVRPESPQSPLLLFDATEPGNLGWFSRCQFYADAASGRVLQTPIIVANCFDARGKLLPQLRISVLKELPASFRMPGRQNVDEQVVYALLYNFLAALKETGIAVCGRGGLRPLAGRATATERH